MVRAPAGNGPLPGANGLQLDPRIEQAEARTELAEARTEQAEMRTEQAKTRTEQAEIRTEQAETRTEQAKTRTEQAEARTEQAETRIEAAITASELSYRRLFEAAKDGILILEADTGRISDANPFLIELLGVSRGEMVGKTVAELSPFQDIESNLIMLERLQRDGYVRYDDLPLETRDGRHIDVEFVSNVYEAGNEKVVQCNIRDITGRKQAEKVSIRLAAIVEFSDDAIIGKDLDGIIQSWNAGAERIFGYSAGEMVDRSITLLIPAERREEEDHILEKIRRGESVRHFETVRQAKDGRQIDVSVTVSPIKDSTGKIVGASKVAREITERKRAQDEIQRLNAELEQRVAERTAQLQAANLELEAFSYSVSHDLRAPLRHVMGFVELLLRGAGPSLSPKDLGHLTTISRSAKRMGMLIDDLLAFSRIGKSELRKTEVGLDQLVQEAAGECQAGAPGRNIAWEIHPLPAVWADRALLRLALVNLLSNAVKFTGGRAEARIEIGPAPAGEGEMGASRHCPGAPVSDPASPEDGSETRRIGDRRSALPGDSGGCVPMRPAETVIFIRDNGVGFDPKYGGKLFGVFQRLHSQDEFEGTGIGLANVQRIIQRHAGRVWAEGTVNGGATFYVSLPGEIGGGHGR